MAGYPVSFCFRVNDAGIEFQIVGYYEVRAVYFPVQYVQYRLRVGAFLLRHVGGNPVNCHGLLRNPETDWFYDARS